MEVGRARSNVQCIFNCDGYCEIAFMEVTQFTHYQQLQSSAPPGPQKCAGAFFPSFSYFMCISQWKEAEPRFLWLRLLDFLLCELRVPLLCPFFRGIVHLFLLDL